jgi:hypothetical protein
VPAKRRSTTRFLASFARVACFYLGLVSILAILVTITRKEVYANSRESERDLDEIGSVKRQRKKMRHQQDGWSQQTTGMNTVGRGANLFASRPASRRKHPRQAQADGLCCVFCYFSCCNRFSHTTVQYVEKNDFAICAEDNKGTPRNGLKSYKKVVTVSKKLRETRSEADGSNDSVSLSVRKTRKPWPESWGVRLENPLLS